MHEILLDLGGYDEYRGYKNTKNIEVITSENNKELEKRLKELSQELITENYELYKELENC